MQPDVIPEEKMQTYPITPMKKEQGISDSIKTEHIEESNPHKKETEENKKEEIKEDDISEQK